MGPLVSSQPTPCSAELPRIEPLLEEVRVRAGGRVDDGVRPVHDLELVLAPVGLLGALVLAVADPRRLALERLGGVLGLEEELDHLPVAFVEVVPVVVGVEEPVLKRQLAGVARVADDVRVDGRGLALAQAARPELVGAARVERVSGEVEVVLVEPAGEVLGGRPDLDEVAAAPGPAQRDCRLVEEEIDVQRLVRLSGPAFLELLDEADDRRVALGEGDLVLEVGRSGRGANKRRRRVLEEGPRRGWPILSRARDGAARARPRWQLAAARCSPCTTAHSVTFGVMDEGQLLRGALDAAVLAVVAENDGYGYDVLRRLRTAGMTEVGDASVRGTLRRLYRSGALTSYVMPSDEGPHRRYYGMTDRGRGQLEEARAVWDVFRTKNFLRARYRTGGDRSERRDAAPDDVGRYFGAVRDRWSTSPPTGATTCSLTSATHPIRSRSGRGGADRTSAEDMVARRVRRRSSERRPHVLRDPALRRGSASLDTQEARHRL